VELDALAAQRGVDRVFDAGQRDECGAGDGAHHRPAEGLVEELGVRTAGGGEGGEAGERAFAGLQGGDGARKAGGVQAAELGLARPVGLEGARVVALDYPVPGWREEKSIPVKSEGNVDYNLFLYRR